MIPEFSSALRSLPPLLPENQLALSIFARKFFRHLFSMLPAPWLLVFDNCQEVPADSPLIELLLLCLQELPVGCKTIFLSRTAPPASFAKIKSEGLLQCMTPETILFTEDEVGDVLTLHGITGEQEDCIQYLKQTTKGWAAGITLMLQEQNRESCVHDEVEELDHSELFDYFAGVVFAGFNEKKKELLTISALLPDIRPAMLDRIYEGGNSRDFFLHLKQNSFFTYQLDKKGELFQFHPLFREFLRNRATQFFSAEEWRLFHKKITGRLLAENRIADAVELLNQSELWEESAELIENHGAPLLRQGCFKTLLRWQDALPCELIEKNPQLLYLFGNATTAFNPPAAIETLTKGFQLFRSVGNQNGCLLACSALTNSIINHLSDIKVLDPWLDYMIEQLDPALFPATPSFEELTFVNAIFRAMVLRRPDHPDLEAWRLHIIRLGEMPPALITYYLWTGKFVEARSTLDRIHANIDRITSKLQLSAILAMEVQYFLVMGEPDECQRVITESLQMMEETGIRVWEVHFLILGGGCLLNCGKINAASHYMADVEKKMERGRLLERSYYHAVKTLEALLTDELSAADHHQQSALDMALEIGMPSYTMWCWYGAALVAVFQGNTDTAVSRFDKVFKLAESPGNPWFVCQSHMGLAWMYLSAGQQAKAAEHLYLGFNLARSRAYLSFFYFVPKMMCDLAVLALEENIEPEFTCRFIRRWQLTPASPPLHLANWPWPLKIYTLGRFSIIRDGIKINAASLNRNKPIQLLQALIAAGGRQVNKTLLANYFWPDSDGDEQMASLKVTLHRLRGLLKVKNALMQTPQTLTLNPHICWVDGWQFERLAGAYLSMTEQDPGIAAIAKKRALDFYSGHFLPSCEGDSWTISHRNQLQNLFDMVSRK